MKAVATKTESKSASRSLFINGSGQGGFWPLQAKLSVNKPGDHYEQEADRIADKVSSKAKKNETQFISASTAPAMQRQAEEQVQEKPLAQSITPLVQRQAESEELQRKTEEEKVQAKADDEEAVQQKEEEEPVQAKAEEEEEETVQAKEGSQSEAVATAQEVAPEVSGSLQQTKGMGVPLPEPVQADLGQRLGVDLSGVKIHTDSKAVLMNRILHAQAFTHKNNIYFNEGKFQPETQQGKHLLAHEVTHTIQQGAVPVLDGSKQPEEAQVVSGELGATNESASFSQGTNPPAAGDGAAPAETPVQSDNSESKEVSLPTAGDKTVGTPIGDGGQAGVAPVADTYPTNPKEEPNFRSVQQQVQQRAQKQRQHTPASSASQMAQASASSPANERESQAQANQVDNMSQQEPGRFDAASFKARLMERIRNMQLPQNQEEASNFEDNNNIAEVNQAAQQDVQQEQGAASGTIAQSSSASPDVASVPQRQVEQLPAADIGLPAQPVAARTAMPQRRPESQVSAPLQQNMQEVDQQMANNEITEQQLANANEPSFSSALQARQTAQQNTTQAPGEFRQQEKASLAGSQSQAEQNSQLQLQGMHNQRTMLMGQVHAGQQQTATQDTAERTRIANDINGIYDATKRDVGTILTALDETVNTRFTTAAQAARTTFEAYVEKKMDAYKDRRYSGVRGKLRWIRDKFAGIPDEVNVFFTEGRQLYIDEMDVAITGISQLVADKLNEAKDRIARGKQEVSDYVIALPQNLQAIGQQAAESIQNQFDELESQVDSRQDELIDSLAQQYVESLQAVDARIKEMKAANRGLIDRALDAIKAVVQTIIQIKNVLTNILRSAISVIRTIISDPIGFLRNLLSGIGQGFRNFGSNILRHLMTGMLAWLTGALGPMGITIPEDLFSLKGIFSLVMQVLGLTWNYMRTKAVKLLGEPVVSALERGFEVFQVLQRDGVAGLWNYIKEQFNDLKETVIDAIQDMVITQVIEAGIKWVLGLFNPVGAFIKAAMLIIDVVKFFIERGRQIIVLVEAFIEGVAAVASGSVARVAQAIESALARAIPVVIGFLAALLGIGGLASKVQKIITKIRKRIDKAIDKLILKAQKWFRKMGSKIKGVAAKFVKWWKAKKVFRGNDGKSHRLYFTGEEASARLMVASNPTAFTDFINSVDVGTDTTKRNAKTQALVIAGQIDSKKREPVAGANETEKSANSKKKQDEIEALLSQLSVFAKELFGTAEGDLPETEVDYQSGDMGGDTMGKRMTARLLTKKGDAGSVPSSRGHIVFDRLLKRRLGGSSYYIRGHLLNHNTHGPGQWENMTPLSKEGNRLHESVAESKVKAAVASGAIVYYFVKPVYGRAALETPNDADSTIREIRNAEQHVPFGLEVEANILKPKAENFAKKKTLVTRQTITNPINTSIGSYELNSSSRDRVILTTDSAEKIAANTGGKVGLNDIDSIQAGANAVKSKRKLFMYEQIKKELPNQTDLHEKIDKLKELSNVVLNP